MERHSKRLGLAALACVAGVLSLSTPGPADACYTCRNNGCQPVSRNARGYEYCWVQYLGLEHHCFTHGDVCDGRGYYYDDWFAANPRVGVEKRAEISTSARSPAVLHFDSSVVVVPVSISETVQRANPELAKVLKGLAGMSRIPDRKTIPLTGRMTFEKSGHASIGLGDGEANRTFVTYLVTLNESAGILSASPVSVREGQETIEGGFTFTLRPIDGAGDLQGVSAKRVLAGARLMEVVHWSVK